jgi:hypothetical protein
MGLGSSRSPLLAQGVAEARLGPALPAVRAAYEGLCDGGRRVDQSLFASAVVKPPVPGAVARALFALFDVHGRGFLSWPEFVSGIAILVTGTQDEKAEWLYRLYDVDGDGVVTAADFKHMLAVDLLARTLPAQQIASVIDMLTTEAVPDPQVPLTKAALLAWAQAHTQQSSLASWVFSEVAMPIAGAPGAAPVTAAETAGAGREHSAAPRMEPLDLTVQCLQEVVGQQGRLPHDFLADWGYEDAGRAQVSTFFVIFCLLRLLLATRLCASMLRRARCCVLSTAHLCTCAVYCVCPRIAY